MSEIESTRNIFDFIITGKLTSTKRNILRNLLIKACEEQNLEEVKALLRAASFSSIYHDPKCILVFKCLLAANHNKEIIESLIVYFTYGSFPYEGNTNPKSGKYTFLLLEAIKRNHIDLVEYLIILGTDVNKKKKRDYTMLQMAINEGYIDIAKLLIENNADLRPITQLNNTINEKFYKELQNDSKFLTNLNEENKDLLKSKGIIIPN